MSRASPTRPTGRLLPTLSKNFSRSVALILRQRFVRTTPGDTALTRIGANSIAKARVKASIVPQTLDAITHPFCGRWLAMPVVRTRKNLQVHHKEFRSHSGDDSENNVITLCPDVTCGLIANSELVLNADDVRTELET